MNGGTMKKFITLFGVVLFAFLVSACEPPSSESALQSLQFDQRSFTLEINQTAQLRPSVEGVNNADIRYESDAPLIVSVSATGLIRGLRPGIASIKVTAGTVVDYASVLVLQPVIEPVLQEACVTKEVIQAVDLEFIIVCEDGSTVPTGIKAPVLEAEVVGIVSTEVNADGDLIVTYSNGDVVNAGNVVGPQGQRGLTGASGGGTSGAPGAAGAKGDKGADGDPGEPGPVITTARDGAEFIQLASVSSIDEIYFTDTITITLTASQNLEINYIDLISVGNFIIKEASSSPGSPSVQLTGIGTHIGNLTIDMPAGSFAIDEGLTISGVVTVSGVSATSFVSNATHNDKIAINGPGRFVLQENASNTLVELDTNQNVVFRRYL
jgi:hypothetical protein